MWPRQGPRRRSPSADARTPMRGGGHGRAQGQGGGPGPPTGGNSTMDDDTTRRHARNAHQRARRPSRTLGRGTRGDSEVTCRTTPPRAPRRRHELDTRPVSRRPARTVPHDRRVRTPHADHPTHATHPTRTDRLLPPHPSARNRPQPPPQPSASPPALRTRADAHSRPEPPPRPPTAQVTSVPPGPAGRPAAPVASREARR